MIFENIECLFLLLLLIPYIIWYIMRHKQSTPAMQVSDTHAYMKVPRSYKVYLMHAPFLLRLVALTMLVLVIARPQTHPLPAVTDDQWSPLHCQLRFFTICPLFL